MKNPYTIPSKITYYLPELYVRPKSNELLSYRLVHIMLRGKMDSQKESLFDEDGFVFQLALSQESHPEKDSLESTHSESNPSFLTIHVLGPSLVLLWESGGKELVSHFLAGKLHTLRIDKTKEPPVLHLDINISKSNRRRVESENLAQQIAYLRFLLLMGPIFKYFRRSIYGSREATIQPCIYTRNDELVWIFNSSHEFLIALCNKKTCTMTQGYNAFLSSISEQLNLQLASQENYLKIRENYGSRLPSHLLQVLQKVAQHLKFNYQATAPPSKVVDYCKKHQIPEPEGHWFLLNLVKACPLVEADCFPMCKLVVGLQSFLKTSFRNQLRALHFELNAAAVSIASLSCISTYKHPL